MLFFPFGYTKDMPASKTAKLLFYSHDKNLNLHLKEFFRHQPFHLTIISDLNHLKQQTSPHYIIIYLPLSLPFSQTENLLTQSYALAQSSQSKIAFLVIDDFFENSSSNNLDPIRQKLSSLSLSQPLHRLILSQNLYSPLHPSPISSFERNLLTSIQKQKITITRKGNHSLYPTSLSDLLSGLLKSLFLQHTTNQEFVIIGEQIKDLSLAYLLKKTIEKDNITLDIDTTLSEPQQITNWQQRSSFSQAQLNWKPKLDTEQSLKEKINLLVSYTPKSVGETPSSVSPPPPPPASKKFSFPSFSFKFPKRQKKSPPPKTPSPLKKRIFNRGISYVLLSLFILYLFPSFLWLTTLFRSVSLTQSSFSSLRQGELDISTRRLVSAQRNYRFTQSLTSYFILPFDLISPSFSTKTSNLVNLLGQLQSTLYSTQQNYLLAEELYQSLFDPLSSSQPYDLSLALESQIGLLHHQIDQLQLSLQHQSLPVNLTDKIITSLDPLSLDKLQSQVSQSFTYSQLLTQILRSSPSRNFVLVLQDSNQLRPSGGIASSVLTFSLTDNRLSNFQSFSLSDLASQQDGQLETPSFLQTITGQTNSNFTDINYNPDFTSTAVETSRFFTNFLNFKPDAIFYLNTSSLSKLIKEIGEIDINGQLITPDSFNSLLLQQDIDSSSLLIKQLTQRLTQMFQTNQIPFSSFSRIFLDSYEASSFQAYFSDPLLENLIINSSLAGNISNYSCHPLLPSQSCITDLIYLNEANYTNSPINFYQTRQLDHQVTFSSEGVTHTLTLDYFYSPTVPSLNRPYLPIYQVFLPSSSSFLTAKLNQEIIDTKPLVSTTSASLVRFEFSLPQPLSSSNKVQLSFLRPWSVGESYSPSMTYSLTTIRQPSTFSQPYQLTINTPSESIISAITTPVTSTPTGLLLSIPSSSPYVFGVQYSSP